MRSPPYQDELTLNRANATPPAQRISQMRPSRHNVGTILACDRVGRVKAVAHSGGDGSSLSRCTKGFTPCG